MRSIMQKAFAIIYICIGYTILCYTDYYTCTIRHILNHPLRSKPKPRTP